jgi:hypothetical protein
MTTRKTTPNLALLIAAVATLAVNGCSLIGLGIGASIDSSRPNQKTVPGWQAAAIKPGTAVTVVLKDGTRLSGKYAGPGHIPAEQYAAIYSQAREQLPEGILPALGDSIDIGLFLEKAKEQTVEGTFEGFEHDRILTTLKGRTGLSDVHLSTVIKIVGNGEVVFGETLKRLIFEGKIAVLSAIVVEGGAGKTWVQMDNVSQIETPVKEYGALIGFLVGVPIDASIAFFIYALANCDGCFNYLGGG